MTRKPISPQLRFQILERDAYACQCCGARAPNVTLHVDHVVPVARGGANDSSNLRAICVTCNIGKSDRVVVAFSRPDDGPGLEPPAHILVRGEALSRPIYWIGEQWGVTSYGLEALDGTYVIEKERLWQDEAPTGMSYGWVKHMGQKLWVNQPDFYIALYHARERFKDLKPEQLRNVQTHP